MISQTIQNCSPVFPVQYNNQAIIKGKVAMDSLLINLKQGMENGFNS